jgi:hypothetical protein
VALLAVVTSTLILDSQNYALIFTGSWGTPGDHSGRAVYGMNCLRPL